MADYHKYVFDTEQRRLVGAFEEMYRHEQTEGFDSWHQEDSRQLNRQIDLLFFQQYNFTRVVDIGTGKGALAHLLKRRNNAVVGLDISDTAVATAATRYPDMEFLALDVNHIESMRRFYTERKELWGGVDLTFSSECLSYLSNWKELIELIAEFSGYFLVSLYLPDDPIGSVKSGDELVETIAEFFHVEEVVRLQQAHSIIVFASRK